MRFRVAQFVFARDASRAAWAERPRKVLLSPNKQLLLILGAYHRGRKSLLVYQIVETYPNPFHLVFYDYAFTYVDVCFTPDSRRLVCITMRHPHHLLVMDLPLIECPQNKMYESSNSLFFSATAKKNAEHHVYSKELSAFQPRSTGPVDILGPSLSALTGQPLVMSHIVGSSDPSEEAFHFFTWGDGNAGEYCLWSLTRRADTGRCMFEVHPRLLAPEVNDAAWLAHPDSPKTRILSASFADAASMRLMVVVRHEKFGRPQDNGIGIQSCDLSVLSQGLPLYAPSGFGVWYQVSESLDADDVVCAKWTQPLLIGKEISAAVVLKKKGLFELVSHRCGSAFQASNEAFVGKCSNFVHVGRFHRYWTKDGELRALIVTPQVASSHPEWVDVCRKGGDNNSGSSNNGNNSNNSNSGGNGNSAELQSARMLARRIGYSIHDVQRENNPVSLASLYAARKGAPVAASAAASSSGAANSAPSSAASKKARSSAAAAAAAAAASAVAASGVVSKEARDGGAAADLFATMPEPYVSEAEEFVGIHLHRCWCCRAVLLKPLLCSRCAQANYCSQQCQLLDWDFHKTGCRERRTKS